MGHDDMGMRTMEYIPGNGSVRNWTHSLAFRIMGLGVDDWCCGISSIWS